MTNIGRERLDRRHRIHVIVRGTIDGWNAMKEKLHLGDRIDLAAIITEAIMDDDRPEQTAGMPRP
jgi:hypothetical protein